VQRTHALRQKRLYELEEQQEAANIQRGLMPSEISAPPGTAISASSHAARTVGGDYYDVIRLGEHSSAFCIADVVGKGVAAALLMSNLQAAVRMLAPELRDPAALCRRVNQAVSANNVPGKFITFFYCVLDARTRRLAFTNAGHNWPVLAHADGTIERLRTDDTVLGTTPGSEYHQTEVQLRSGDRLVLFTDGITEACDASGEEFGEDTLQQLISCNVSLSAADLQSTLLEAARAHCSANWTDDATLIVLAVE
jgi:sigma-B regulation protein RsbU (phosphoserine phosphatase)